MHKRRSSRLILSGLLFRVLLLGLCGWTVAADTGGEARVLATLGQTFPDLEVTSINPAPIPGLYEVMLGPEVVYVSADGRYLLQGDLLDLMERRNRSEDLRADARTAILAAIPLEEVIEFAPEKPDYTVYAFTDVSCGYCRRLHRDVPELNRMGIAIRYVAFPRHGPDSQSFRDMQAVWCSKDRKQAMTDAKNGKAVAAGKCDDPVARQYELGRSMGVHGTPAMFATNGQALPGYMPPKELLETLREIYD